MYYLFKNKQMSATPPAATGRRGRHPHLLLLGLGLGLASLLASPAAAYLCTEEPPAVRKQEGGCAWYARAVRMDGMLGCDRGGGGPTKYTHPTSPTHTGETCGGACFSEGICADGLVCGPSPADAAFLAAAPENAKIRDFVDHVLGRAATGVCVPPQAAPVLAAAPEAVRELREGRALPTAGALVFCCGGRGGSGSTCRLTD